MIERSLLTANDFIGVRASLVELLGNDAASALVVTRIYFRADERWREAIERNDEWWWRASVPTIAAETGLAETQVQRIVQKLAEAGHIERVKHHLNGTSDHTYSYRVICRIDPAISQDQEPSDSRDLPSMQTVEEERDSASALDPNRPTAVALAFNQFWALYPRLVGKPAAQRAFSAAVKRLPRHLDASVIVRGAATFRRFCQATQQEQRFIPYPATWLNRDGWNDELVVPATPATPLVQQSGPRRLTPVERNLETFASMRYDDEPPLPIEPPDDGPIDWGIEPPEFRP